MTACMQCFLRFLIFGIFYISSNCCLILVSVFCKELKGGYMKMGSQNRQREKLFPLICISLLFVCMFG